MKVQIFFAVVGIALGAIQLLPATEHDKEMNINAAMNDSVYPAEIEIKPSSIQLDFTPSEFVTTDITIMNRGGQPLEIKRVKASCYCANAAVIHSTINPFGLGKIRLAVNTEKLTDSLQRVDYTIWSNARDSVFTFPVILRRVVKDTVKP